MKRKKSNEPQLPRKYINARCMKKRSQMHECNIAIKIIMKCQECDKR